MNAKKVKNILESVLNKKNRINESDNWLVYTQAINGYAFGGPPNYKFQGTMKDCLDYIKNNINSHPSVSGVIVDENAIKNIFFKFDNGNLTTSSSPYPGCKYMLANKFEPFN